VAALLIIESSGIYAVVQTCPKVQWQHCVGEVDKWVVIMLQIWGNICGFCGVQPGAPPTTQIRHKLVSILCAKYCRNWSPFVETTVKQKKVDISGPDWSLINSTNCGQRKVTSKRVNFCWICIWMCVRIMPLQPARRGEGFWGLPPLLFPW